MAYAQDYQGGRATLPVGAWHPAYDESGCQIWYNDVTFATTKNLRVDTPYFQGHPGIPVIPGGPRRPNSAANGDVYRAPNGQVSPNGHMPPHNGHMLSNGHMPSSNGNMSPNGRIYASGYTPPVDGYTPPTSGHTTPAVGPADYGTTPPNAYGMSGPLPYNNGYMMTSPPPGALGSSRSPPPQPQGEPFSVSPRGRAVETWSQAPVMQRRYSSSSGSTYAKGGFVCGGYRWEECYKSTGKKFWRHKETGVVVHKDPYV